MGDAKNRGVSVNEGKRKNEMYNSRNYGTEVISLFSGILVENRPVFTPRDNELPRSGNQLYRF